MMKCQPLISVIVPTFNSSPFIRRCLDSLLNQSVKDIEIIAVDDKSTDDTVKVIDKYVDENSNIHKLQLNSKLLAGGARNAGMKVAKGEYISFVDSDDWIDTNYYYHMLAVFNKTEAEIVICGVKREYDNAKNTQVRYKYSVNNIIDGNYALVLLSRMIDQDISISSIVCNKLFKSNFIRKYNLKFIENCLNEDDIFTFKAFLNARKVGITEKTTYHLYQRKNSASRGFTKKHIDDLFFAFEEIRNLLILTNKFDTLKACYYAFFEKCLSYLIESLRMSEQNEEVINDYFKYAFAVSKDAISINEFIDYCGSKRISKFFTAI